MIRNYDENALLESSEISLLFNLIVSVYTLNFILPSSLNLCFIIDLVLSELSSRFIGDSQDVSQYLGRVKTSHVD